MFKNLVLRKGIVQGQTIVLQSPTGLAEGQSVMVGIGVPDTGTGEVQLAQEELARELEAEEALQTIQRMRHSGRSLRDL